MSGNKYVCNGAKIECPLCTKKQGTLVVTSNMVKLQDKLFANESDSKKVNLRFSGKCKASYKQKIPCVALIAPTKWINTGEILVQGSKALLECSTIQCSYGGATISIKDHIQKATVSSVPASDVDGVSPQEPVSENIASTKVS